MAMNPDSASKGTIKIENTEKRDVLIATEKDFQRRWRERRVFESNAPSLSEYPASTRPEVLHVKYPKFFGTMAYPYVNGSAHLGHAFTISKIEYAARVSRSQGKRTLYPQGYHCTGMPIKASADKVLREIRMFGKDFSGWSETDVVANGEPEPPAPTQGETKTDVTQFRAKKSKAVMKAGAKTKYQFQVMLSLGVPLEEIHLFADAAHWLRYFPQIWQKDLTDFGCAIDWRRSFVTTDANPYYDRFIRWQMRRLKALGKIQYGKRYTVYSPLDGQPCLDHDRQSGEGVLVQEYLGLRCRVKKWSEKAEKDLAGLLPADARVFMIPATLRPETMYGQNLLFVSPTLKYGVFKVSDKEFYFVTPRAARNMAYQGISPNWGEFPMVADLKGADVVGSIVEAPLSKQGEVRVVPMDTIKESKGTGVVTSVPSDSPDDYAMTLDLAKKPDFYGIKKEWVPVAPLPIIETPTYGNLTAPAIVKKMKINSPKDAKALAEAKELAYKEGFYGGKMIYGEFKGKTVQEVKPLVRQALLDSGDAIVYCEPDGQVISRSGDECVAALLDQWFLTYGEADQAWRQDVLDHVYDKDGQHFNTFGPETKHAISQTLSWLHQWALTRNYGLGTRLPWDESQLVESLSDSTIYMAYYTISHYLHSDLYGEKLGIGKIEPSQMVDEVWEYVFSLRDEVQSDIPIETLNAMRREFCYWYPLDVRISGKDLINNHLIFFLYIHQAIWGKIAPRYLPKGIRMNGHATLNGEKMSKSTGNFLTLSAALEKFGADAVRIGLADAGDGVEDANFEESVANAVILKLYELRKWIEEQVQEARLLKDSETFGEVKEKEKLRNADVIQRTGKKVFWDEVFENELNLLTAETIRSYESTAYKAALKSGFYDLTAARDSYRTATSAAGVGVHHDSVLRYVALQAQLLAPLAPHWAEYIYSEVLKKPTHEQDILFPPIPTPNDSLTAASKYVDQTRSEIGSAEGAQLKRLAKGKQSSYDPKADKKLTIFVAKSFPSWQQKYVDLVAEKFDGMSLDMKAVTKGIDKADMKKAMPFVQNLKRKLEGGENKKRVFNRQLEFDEVRVLKEMVPGLKATVVKLKQVAIVLVEEGSTKGLKISEDGKEQEVSDIPGISMMAEPGSPSFEFSNDV